MTLDRTTDQQEWASVRLDLACWKPLTRDEEADYERALLRKFPPTVLKVAVQRLLHAGGRPFRPSSAEIINEAIEVMFPELAPVSWTEVWSAINAARRHVDFPRNASITERARWVGDQVTAEIGPIAGAFASQTFGDLQHAPISGGERSGAAVGALRNEWDRHQQIVRGRVLRGGRVLSPAEVLRRGDRVSPLGGGDGRLQLRGAA